MRIAFRVPGVPVPMDDAVTQPRLNNLEDIRAAVSDDAVYSFNVDEVRARVLEETIRCRGGGY